VQSSKWVSKCHPDPKSIASFVKCEVGVNLLLLWRCHSTRIFTSWPECQHTDLAWSNEISSRGSEKPDSWRVKKWMLHHDNTPTHSLLICDFLPKYETILIPQTPYLPDLAPADYFLFLKLQFTLKVNVLRLLRTSKTICWWNCMLFHKKHSSNASKTVKKSCKWCIRSWVN
jgi:hypothetical protein